MKKYRITIKYYQGEILICYDASGNYTSIENSIEMKTDQLQWLTARVVSVELLLSFQQAQKLNDKFTIEQVPIEVDFEQFYKVYNNKVGKKEGANRWKRMSKAQQLQAYLFIDKYKRRVAQQQVAMMYPATYLNAEPWND